MSLFYVPIDINKKNNRQCISNDAYISSLTLADFLRKNLTEKSKKPFKFDVTNAPDNLQLELTMFVCFPVSKCTKIISMKIFWYINFWI